MKFFDVSMSIDEQMLVYPGNPPVKITQVSRASKTKTALSNIEMGSHTGTHVDAPRHIKKSGKPIDKLDLEHFYGKCTVYDLTNIRFGNAITKLDLEKLKIKAKDIVLFKTKNSNIRKWRDDYVYMSVEAAKYLAKLKVKTVGVDYLSIQKLHQGFCAAHCEFLQKRIPIIEGLRMKSVTAGKYTFCGAPLKIRGADGAPMRAFLVK